MVRTTTKKEDRPTTQPRSDVVDARSPTDGETRDDDERGTRRVPTARELVFVEVEEEELEQEPALFRRVDVGPPSLRRLVVGCAPLLRRPGLRARLWRVIDRWPHSA
mmetsp:Transcript_11733/g.35197  ORF Transcript_11733/g.35197 Transcript_11733/m.35197 type:complete len:107 (+) Transcript_11733:398-718(+)